MTVVGERLAALGGTPALQRGEEIAAASRWPAFGADEKEAVLAVLERGAGYDEIYAFEREFAAFTGARHALAHVNGTSSLHAAFFAAGVQPGDEVIFPAYTWSFQVSPLLALHGIPVFCDVEPVAGCLDPEAIEARLSPRTRAIAVLHPFGAVAPLDEIVAVARRHGLRVIEDCSHAHGATYLGRPVGTIGDVGCFSLQASKLLTAIEGGILVTNDAECYARACLLGHYERLPLLGPAYRRYNDPEQEMAPTSFGFKYRMNPLAAAVARAQLRRYPERLATLRRNMRALTGALAGRHEAFVPAPEAPGTERVWLNYLCQYFAEQAGGVPRARFIEALIAEGVPATPGRAGYLPVYWNPLYEERAMWAPGYPFDAPYTGRRVPYERGLCPQAEQIWRRQVGLPVLRHPCDPALIAELAGAVAKVLRGLAQL